MSNTLQARLFLGYLLQGEIALFLQQLPQANKKKWSLEKPLDNAYYNDKEYLGLFIEQNPTLASLKESEKKIKQQLQLYCPKLNLDKQKIHLFTQVFLG
jgi:hypothetical protein